MPQNQGNFHPGMNGQFQHQYDYGSEYGDEDGQGLDEDGQPLRSPEEIKNIINAIPSFKYEEKEQPKGETNATADSSSKKEDEENK